MVRLTFIILVVSLSGCIERGEKMRKDYPTLTERRKIELEYELLQYIQSDKKVEEFYEPIQEWLNHLIDISDEDFASKGIDIRYMKTNRIRFVSEERMKTACGGTALGCSFSNLITILNSLNVPDFYRLVFHEIGHTTDANRYSEYASQGNEIYLSLKSYQFSKAIGSFLITDIQKGAILDELNEVEDFYDLYVRGTLSAIYSLIQHNGDLEEAQAFNQNTKYLILSLNLKDKLNGMIGNTTEKYFHLWNELLDIQGFKDSLSERLTIVETDELIDYLRIINYKNNLNSLINKVEETNTYVDLRNEFLGNSLYMNEHFYTNVYHW